jgi:hypothetical protein
MLRAMSGPSPRIRRRGPLLALALAAASPSVAAAQQAPDAAAAKIHHDAAEAAMAKGDFAAAAREYTQAYDASRDPALFEKLGVAFRKAGDCVTAVAYFRRYLAEAKPDAAGDARVRAQIVECKGDPGPPSSPSPAPTPPAPQPAPADLPPSASPSEPAPAATPAAPAAGPPIPLEPPVTWQRTAAWTSVGVTAALASAGLALGLSARSREEDVTNLVEFRDLAGEPARFTGATEERYRDLVREGQRLVKASIFAFSAAGASAVAAVVFFLLDARVERAPVALVPTIGEGQAGLAAGWSF